MNIRPSQIFDRTAPRTHHTHSPLRRHINRLAYNKKRNIPLFLAPVFTKAAHAADKTNRFLFNNVYSRSYKQKKLEQGRAEILSVIGRFPLSSPDLLRPPALNERILTPPDLRVWLKKYEADLGNAQWQEDTRTCATDTIDITSTPLPFFTVQEFAHIVDELNNIFEGDYFDCHFSQEEGDVIVASIPMDRKNRFINTFKHPKKQATIERFMRNIALNLAKRITPPHILQGRQPLRSTSHMRFPL